MPMFLAAFNLLIAVLNPNLVQAQEVGPYVPYIGCGYYRTVAGVLPMGNRDKNVWSGGQGPFPLDRLFELAPPIPNKATKFFLGCLGDKLVEQPKETLKRFTVKMKSPEGFPKCTKLLAWTLEQSYVLECVDPKLVKELEETVRKYKPKSKSTLGKPMGHLEN